MSLRFIEREEHYSVYLDRDGDEVLLGHGLPRRVVVEWSEVNLYEEWEKYARDLMNDPQRYWQGRTVEEFQTRLRLLTYEPEQVEYIVLCESCGNPHHRDYDDMFSVASGWACRSCYYDHYSDCNRCDESHARDDMTWTLHETYVCEGCLERAYQWCEDCDGYHHRDHAAEHRHHGCECEAPAQQFTIRNDGDPVLHQDEQVTVQLPAGIISEQGLQEIVRLVSNQGYDVHQSDSQTYEEYDEERRKWWTLASTLHELGVKWQTKDGNYTKRLSRHAYKTLGLKVPPDLLSTIGCIARDHSTAVDFRIEVTRNLNLSAAEFYHEDSCWWQSYSYSRCTLKSNGGFGMRTFSDDGSVTGRAWVIPLKQTANGDLTPTFETLEPAAFVVFNGYGNLGGYAPARIMSHMAGMTYRKIEFGASEMYVNGDSGYLIAPEEIATNYTDGSLSLSLSQHATLHTAEQRVLVNVA